MFNSLKVAAVEAAAPPVVEAPAVMNEALVDAFIDALPDVPAHMALVADHRQTQTELNALISAIETHGLSKSLVAFAGHDGTLFAVAPSIPALEAFTADLSAEDTAKIVAELKALDLTAPSQFDADADVVEPAEESLLAIAAAYVVLMHIVSWIAVYRKYKLMKIAADDEEGHLAKTLPFETLVNYLKAADTVPGVCKELEDLALPKTEEECQAFVKKVEGMAKPLEQFGLHMDGEHIVLKPFPKPVKNKIETLGWHDNSLMELAELAVHAKNKITEAHRVSFEHMHEEYQSMPKAERKIAGRGYDLAFDVAMASIHRLVKVLKLVKSSISGVKHLYHEG